MRHVSFLLFAGIVVYLSPVPTAQIPTAKPIVVTDTLSDSKVRDTLVIHLAHKHGIDTALALDVSHAENWTGNPHAVSPAGAIGLMQVMPFWRGTYPECGEDLYDRFTNVCYGIRILDRYLAECNRNTYCATNMYNGARGPKSILSYQSELGRARGRRAS